MRALSPRDVARYGSLAMRSASLSSKHEKGIRIPHTGRSHERRTDSLTSIPKEGAGALGDSWRSGDEAKDKAILMLESDGDASGPGASRNKLGKPAMKQSDLHTLDNGRT